MKVISSLAALVLFTTCTAPAFADETRFRVDIVGADFDLDESRTALFHGSYLLPNEQVPLDSPGTSLAELTLAMSLGVVELFATWQPELESEARSSTTVGAPSGLLLVDSLQRVHVEAWDLGVSRTFSWGRHFGLAPRLGLTHLRHGHLVNRDQSYPPPTPSWFIETERVTASQWGLLVGAEAVYELSDRVDVVVDGCLRWATGSERVSIDRTSPIFDADGVQVGVEVDPAGRGSLDLTTLMTEGSAGLRVKLRAGLSAEASYLIRDWSRDRGPGTYSGIAVGIRGEW